MWPQAFIVSVTALLPPGKPTPLLLNTLEKHLLLFALLPAIDS